MLTLEDCSQIIHLNQSEANIVKKYLRIKINQQKNGTWNREQQLKKNQSAIKLLQERITRHQLMSEEESQQRTEFFADFKKTIDAERSVRKLYEF